MLLEAQARAPNYAADIGKQVGLLVRPAAAAPCAFTPLLDVRLWCCPVVDFPVPARVLVA
jgi:hypothetical protein